MPGFIRRFLQRRRYPTLLLIAAALFLINVFTPDPLPMIDELLMLIAVLILGSVREKRRKHPLSES